MEEAFDLGNSEHQGLKEEDDEHDEVGSEHQHLQHYIRVAQHIIVLWEEGEASLDYLEGARVVHEEMQLEHIADTLIGIVKHQLQHCQYHVIPEPRSLKHGLVSGERVV